MTTTENDQDTPNTAARLVEITKEPIELFKVLKFEGLVASGGEAKSVIADGQVKVNDTVETRKRRKIHAGDTIAFAGQALLVRLVVKVVATQIVEATEPPAVDAMGK